MNKNFPFVRCFYYTVVPMHSVQTIHLISVLETLWPAFSCFNTLELSKELLSGWLDGSGVAGAVKTLRRAPWLKNITLKNKVCKKNLFDIINNVGIKNAFAKVYYSVWNEGCLNVWGLVFTWQLHMNSLMCEIYTVNPPLWPHSD